MADPSRFDCTGPYYRGCFIAYDRSKCFWRPPNGGYFAVTSRRFYAALYRFWFVALGIASRTLIKSKIKNWTFHVCTYKLSTQQDPNTGLKLSQLGELRWPLRNTSMYSRLAGMF